MATNKEANKPTGMILVVTFFLLLIVNSLVLYVGNMLFPQMIVLGTLSLTVFWSIFHSMLALSLLGTFMVPFVHKFENMRGKMFSPMEWMTAYFVIDLVGIWVIARFPEQFGLGISSWIVAAVLAVILDFLQGLVMAPLEKFRQKLQ